MKSIILLCLLSICFCEFSDDDFLALDWPGSSIWGHHTGIASWYRANNPDDHTNGIGWCGKKYDDNTPSFAPPMGLISPTYATYDKDPEQWRKDTEQWCGMEAKVYNPHTGVTKYLYIYDAFDPTWVKSEYAIDIMIGAFKELNGDPHGDKNIVVKDMQWELTGKKISI